MLHAPEDGKYYMWAASMTSNCTMGEWTTNSEVVLAESFTPLGPFRRLKTLVPPWAHNPQTIRAPDNASTSGAVYALFTMGDGRAYHGQPKNCGPAPPPPPRPLGPPELWGMTHAQRVRLTKRRDAVGWLRSRKFHHLLVSNRRQAHTAQTIGWPTHSQGRPWRVGV